MGDAALVIGISRYADPASEFPGCVDDALRMTGWLIDPSGGKLKPRNVRLLLSRRAVDVAPAPDGVREGPATFAGIVSAAQEMAGVSGTRLFVYFSGHGVTGLVNYVPEPVILASDFTWAMPNYSLTLRSLTSFFATTGYQQQFFFIDACRDLPPRDRPFVWGAFPVVGVPVLPAPEQYGIHATSPLTIANTGVAFTAALLDALEGRGSAKTVDEDALDENPPRLRYVVTYHSALEAAVAAVRAQELPGGAPGSIQIPRGFGEYSSNPVLVGFDVDPTSPADRARFAARIQVAVVPPDAPIDRLSFEGPCSAELAPPTGGPPWEQELFHGSYIVTASAVGYTRGGAWPRLRLFETPPALPSVTVTLLRRPPVRVLEAIQDGPFAFDAPVGLGETTAPHRRVQLTAHSRDPYASLEIVGRDGVRAADFGTVTKELRPGTYTVRLAGDDGAWSQTEIELDGSEREVVVDARSPDPAPALMHLAQVRDTDNTFVFFESLGPLAGLDEITLVALAASVGAWSPAQGGATRLHTLRLFEAVAGVLPEGVAVITSDAGDARLDGAPARRRGTAHGLRADWWSWGVGAGRHLVEVAAMAVPLVVLPMHVTLVVARGGEHPELVVLWLPARPGAESPAEPLQWRSVIRAQRALARNDLHWTRRALDLEPQLQDPARVLLRLAHAALRGDANAVGTAAHDVRQRYPSLPDADFGSSLAGASSLTALYQRSGPPLTNALAARSGGSAASDAPLRRLIPGLAWTAFVDR